MKLLISEKQLKKLVTTLTDEELDEQDFGGSSPADASPKSGASDDQQIGGDGYPEVHKWESGVSRGPDNQVGNTKWSDVVGSEVSRERYPLN